MTFAMFIYYFGAFSFAFGVGFAVLAAVDLINNGGRR